MFYHAYDSYLKFAYPYDELRPVSCDGIDTYGRCVQEKNLSFCSLLNFFVVTHWL